MKQPKKFSGVVVPLITPFTETLLIDEPAVEGLVDYVVQAGCFPFVLGTTGESASITAAEKRKLVAAAVKAAKGRKIVYAGISGNCFAESVKEAYDFRDAGADAVVATLPYYYPIEADQMLRYYEALADAVPLPLVLYNIPQTTHLSLPIDVVEALSWHPNIVAFKDSERGEDRMDKAIALWKDRADFAYLSGWAAKSVTAFLKGADGTVPASANLAPAVYQKIYEAAVEGYTEEAMAAQGKGDAISAIYQQDRVLSKQFPVLKLMMSVFGLCQPYVLPPLYRLAEAAEQQIFHTVKKQYNSLEELNSVQEQLTNT